MSRVAIPGGLTFAGEPQSQTRHFESDGVAEASLRQDELREFRILRRRKPRECHAPSPGPDDSLRTDQIATQEPGTGLTRRNLIQEELREDAGPHGAGLRIPSVIHEPRQTTIALVLDKQSAMLLATEVAQRELSKNRQFMTANKAVHSRRRPQILIEG